MFYSSCTASILQQETQTLRARDAEREVQLQSTHTQSLHLNRALEEERRTTSKTLRQLQSRLQAAEAAEKAAKEEVVQALHERSMNTS